jgi:hypothetical protein
LPENVESFSHQLLPEKQENFNHLILQLMLLLYKTNFEGTDVSVVFEASLESKCCLCCVSE